MHVGPIVKLEPQKGDNIRNAQVNDLGNKRINKCLLRRRNTTHSDPSTNISPKYVPMYSYSRLTKLISVFSLLLKHCHLVDLHPTMAR